ncbi:18S rRNA guanine methyltransferase [Sarotherodon galilaeus]
MTSVSTMTSSQDIAQATAALEGDMQAWDLSDTPDSPPPALLIKTPPTPPPSPQLLQDPTGSGLCEETVIDIKLAIHHLLMLALNDFLQDTCYGCQTAHPSQVQHSCLLELPEYFFDTYHDDVMIRLQTDRFNPAIRLFVRSYTVDGTGTQFRRIAEHTMTELRSSQHIVCAINDNIAQLLEASRYARRVKPAMLRMIGNYWAGRHLV